MLVRSRLAGWMLCAGLASATLGCANDALQSDLSAAVQIPIAPTETPDDAPAENAVAEEAAERAAAATALALAPAAPAAISRLAATRLDASLGAGVACVSARAANTERESTLCAIRNSGSVMAITLIENADLPIAPSPDSSPGQVAVAPQAWRVVLDAPIFSEPDCAGFADGRVACVARSSDAMAYAVIELRDVDGRIAPTVLADGLLAAELASRADCVGRSGRLLCVGRTREGGLVAAGWSDETAGWDGWRQITDGARSTPSCVAQADGRFFCAARSAGDALIVATRAGEEDWSATNVDLPGLIVSRRPECVETQSGRVECFVVREDGGVNRVLFSDGGAVLGESVDGIIDSDLNCVRRNGRIECFARCHYGTLRWCAFPEAEAGEWSGWKQLTSPQTLAGGMERASVYGRRDPSCVARGGVVHCFAWTTDGQLLHWLGE